MIDMWKLTKNDWRIQTDDSSITRKLSRKVGFKRCIWGVNSYLAGFSFNAKTASNAVRTFKRIASQNPELNRKSMVYSV